MIFYKSIIRSINITLLLFANIAIGQIKKIQNDSRTVFEFKNDLFINDSNINYVYALGFAFSLDSIDINENSKEYDLQNFIGNHSKTLDGYKKNHPKQKPLIKFNNNIKDSIGFNEILKNNPENRILILNEEHLRVETRAFLLSLLPVIKENGYTHIAMESISSLDNLKYIGIKNGYYLAEPLDAEILRYALELGFKPLKYDVFSDISNEKRDSLQAFNIVNMIKEHNINKLLVIAGQSHGCEDPPMEIPLLGTILKNHYKIDPLTIDQTRGLAYEIKEIQFNVNNTKKGYFFSSKPLKDSIGFSMFDYFYIHPEYSSINSKPSWLSIGGIKKMYKVNRKRKNAALIQAYYKNEFKLDSGKLATPADMDFNSSKKGIIEFYLRPKKNYIIVYRDIENKIMFKHEFYSK
jgi:hypothetical protein